MSDTGNRRNIFEEIEARESPEVFAQIIGFIALMEGLSDICPKCRTKITEMKQVGRDVYGSCGCYLYKGTVLDEWLKADDKD